MKLRIKAALLALSTGLMALQGWSCVARWAGDAVGDALWLRAID